MNFSRLATRFGDIFGSPFSFVAAILLTLGWLSLGPSLHYSDTWQLIINTPTTVIEWWAAITIQYVGNKVQREQAVQQKLMLNMLEHIQTVTERLEQEVDEVVAQVVSF